MNNSVKNQRISEIRMYMKYQDLGSHVLTDTALRADHSYKKEITMGKKGGIAHELNKQTKSPISSELKIQEVGKSWNFRPRLSL